MSRISIDSKEYCLRNKKSSWTRSGRDGNLKRWSLLPIWLYSRQLKEGSGPNWRALLRCSPSTMARPLPCVWDIKRPSISIFSPMLLATPTSSRNPYRISTYGTVEDLRAVQDFIGLDEFREVRDHAPPGIFDARSWTYWHLKCGRTPAPPLPVRRSVQLIHSQP